MVHFPKKRPIALEDPPSQVALRDSGGREARLRMGPGGAGRGQVLRDEEHLLLGRAISWDVSEWCG